MENFPTNDYGAWEQPLFEWASVEEFQRAASIFNGIHRIGLGEGPTLDLLVQGLVTEDDSETLPIFFNAAVPHRDEKSGPFFSGSVIGAKQPSGFVSIADPSVSLDRKLGLAWYAGNAYSDLVGSLVLILQSLAKRTHRKLLLIGGSGGGFAALHFGSLLGDIASVIVWNPQTDIFRYNADFVRQYLRSAYSEQTDGILDEIDWLGISQNLLDRQGVRTELLTLESRPNRALVFQNASDWHVGVHTAPLIESWELNHLGDGIYAQDQSVYVIIREFGDGHVPLPAEILESAISHFSSSDASAEKFVLQDEKLEKFEPVDPILLPTDLREIRQEILDDVSIQIDEISGSTLKVSARHNRTPERVGGVKYQFGVEESNGNRRLRPFSPLAASTIALNGTESVVFLILKDGFLNSLGEIRLGVST